jgi:hypothetical protein
MQSFIFSVVLVLFAQYASASTTINLESRFGVSFGASTIIVSRFNSSGSMELTTFPVSSEYQAYYREALQNFDASGKYGDIDELKVKSIFRNSISPITKTLREQLGYAPEFASLFVPSIFDVPTEIAAREVIFENVQYTTRAGVSRIAACWPYGFLECKNVGRPAHECNDDGPDNLVFVLEYEEEYMYLWLFFVEYELDVYQTRHAAFCKDCGEKHRKVCFRSQYCPPFELLPDTGIRYPANERIKNESRALYTNLFQRTSQRTGERRFEQLSFLAKHREQQLQS